MSRKARTCVWDDSPYTLGKRLLHLAIADSTAEEHGHFVFATQGWLAQKARLSRQSVNDGMQQMVADGWLVPVELSELPAVVQAMIHDKRSRLYRFILCEACGRRYPDLPSMCRISDTSPERPVGLPDTDLSGLDQPVLLPTEEEPKLTNLRGFEEFWTVYPKRNGKRLGRGKCEAIWSKLTMPERFAAYRAAQNYAAAVEADLTFAKDPERFLRPQVIADWQEPAIADEIRNPRRRGGSLGNLLEKALASEAAAQRELPPG